MIPEFGLKGLKGGIAGLRRSVVSPPGEDHGISREFERMLKLQEILKVKMQEEAEIQIVELREYYHNYKLSQKEESNTDALLENIFNAGDLEYQKKKREQWQRNEQIKQVKAKQKIKWLEKERLYMLERKANYWDEYRELRLKLVAEVIVALKTIKRVKDIITMMQVLKAAKVLLNNFNTTQIKRKRAFRSIFYTIRMFCGYKYRFQKRCGQTLKFRNNNQQRYALTFIGGALVKDKFEQASIEVLRVFLLNVAPNVEFKNRVYRFKSCVETIETIRKDTLFTRILRKRFFTRQFMRELTFLREFFSKRKNPAGRAIVKALKKTTEKDVQEVVELYQHKHYLAFLLQRKRSDLKDLRAHIERQQLLSEEKEWVLDDKRAAASSGKSEGAKEEVARCE